MHEIWRKVWREGIGPQLSTAGLEALRRALADDAPELLQGATTSPPPLQALLALPVEACCAIGYAGWKGDGRATVAEVEEAFAEACHRADEALGQPAASRWFLNWFDDTPRDQARTELLAEVGRVLASRQRPAAA